MNTMNALKFFLEVICGFACSAAAAAWVMLYFLRRRVHAKRIVKAERESASTTQPEMLPH